MARTLMVGTRRSKLALTQTGWVMEQLQASGLPYAFEKKEIITKGDQILDVTLSKVGGKGLFVKEIEQSLLNGETDFAVHSMKDMPAVMPEGLIIGCIPKRVDARDCLISKGHIPLAELKSGAIVGTSSLRRSAQLLHARPDLTIRWIRGNIDTRLRKLQEEDYDAIILASAGLERLGWKEETITQFLPVDICLPAVGQGALGIQCRADDEDVLAVLQHLHDPETAQAVEAERAFLAAVEGGCQVPVAAYAEVQEGVLQITGLVASTDGKTIIKEIMSGQEPLEVGQRLAQKLLEQGGAEILEQVQKELE